MNISYNMACPSAWRASDLAPGLPAPATIRKQCSLRMVKPHPPGRDASLNAPFVLSVDL
jgi:hypothetical protein